VSPALEASHAQVERIIQRENLRLSEVQRRLLIYLVEKSLAGEADDLKEYTIGVDAFGKPPSYDPRQESVVRMHVARLRQKLAEYYRTEGAADPILLDLPKGGFKMVFETRPALAAAAEPETAAAISAAASLWSPRRMWIAAGLVLVLGIAIAGASRWRTTRATLKRPRVGLPNRASSGNHHSGTAVGGVHRHPFVRHRHRRFPPRPVSRSAQAGSAGDSR
jgi:hypothetical protein